MLPVTPEETALYDVLDFSLNDIYNAIGSKTSIHDNEKVGFCCFCATKGQVESLTLRKWKGSLMARWRFPSLSLHGIEGAFYSPGAKTVIPAKVTGKFSIR